MVDAPTLLAGPGPFVSGTTGRLLRVGELPSQALPARVRDTAPTKKRKLPPGRAGSEEPSELLSPAGPASSAGKSKGGPPGGGVTLLDMISAGVLRPGRDNAAVTYKGITHAGSVQANGTILFRGTEFTTPSAFSVYVKRLVTPLKQGDDGWHSVCVDGVMLHQLRARYHARGAGAAPPRQQQLARPQGAAGQRQQSPGTLPPLPRPRPQGSTGAQSRPKAKSPLQAQHGRLPQQRPPGQSPLKLHLPQRPGAPQQRPSGPQQPRPPGAPAQQQQQQQQPSPGGEQPSKKLKLSVGKAAMPQLKEAAAAARAKAELRSKAKAALAAAASPTPSSSGAGGAARTASGAGGAARTASGPGPARQRPPGVPRPRPRPTTPGAPRPAGAAPRPPGASPRPPGAAPRPPGSAARPSGPMSLRLPAPRPPAPVAAPAAAAPAAPPGAAAPTAPPGAAAPAAPPAPAPPPTATPEAHWVVCGRCEVRRRVPDAAWPGLSAAKRAEFMCEDAHWDLEAAEPFTAGCLSDAWVDGGAEAGGG
ncbi:hypothetical protein HT031_002274 [Scenedesmus sp. PABB004]|nr:hypothetical protein HT031_002274 [Scenedesmus sp. PABB004]